MSLFQEYGLYVTEKMEKAIATQEQAITAAGKMIYEAQKAGNTLFIEGSGHSHMLGEEVFSRAGGYVRITPMLEPELMLHEHPMKSTYIERLSGYAQILLTIYKVHAGDVVIIISNSGRNALPVEMALGAKALGAKVIAITNRNHSAQTSSRHESGKKLMDLADIVIDNCGDYGDAAFEIPGFPHRVGATSTAIGAFIIQALVIEILRHFVDNGESPEVFVSSNLDGSDERNRRLMDICTDRYRSIK